MNRPNQVVPSFASVYLSANQAIGAVYEIILFDIIETDGSDPEIYNRTTGEFTAPVSGWYDLEVQIILSGALDEIRVVKNRDTNFPIIGRVVTTTDIVFKVRNKLATGETLRIEAIDAGGVNVLALAGTTPEARGSNAIFTLVKRFDDTKTF